MMCDRYVVQLVSLVTWCKFFLIDVFIHLITCWYTSTLQGSCRQTSQMARQRRAQWHHPSPVCQQLLDRLTEPWQAASQSCGFYCWRRLDLLVWVCNCPLCVSLGPVIHMFIVSLAQIIMNCTPIYRQRKLWVWHLRHQKRQAPHR